MNREHYWIDETGEACCSYSGKETKAERKYRLKRAREYWNSLTDAQRAIIDFCRTDKIAIKEGLGIAQARERKLDQFYLLVSGQSEVPKKVDKYDFIYDNFDAFKKYIGSLN